MRRPLVLAIAAALLARAGDRADAHVAPSVDDNNRYLKLTPLGDRVRLAYIVFFGEVPGAQLRPTLDTNRDGSISDAEAQVFGTRLGREIGAALDLSVDGKQQPIAWSTISVGLGTPGVRGGSFSVDLVAYACLPVARGHHELRLFDRFRVLRPGETEVKVEDSPGVKIDRAKIGDQSDPSLLFKFAGPGGPLQDHGLDLAFTAGEQSFAASDEVCGKANAAAAARRPPTAALVGAAAFIGFLLAAGFVFIQRRRRRSSSSSSAAS